MSVAEDQKSPRNLVWMGRVQAAAKRPEEAEKLLNKAVELAPADPLTWRRVQFLAGEKGRRPEALAALEKAKGAGARRPEGAVAGTLPWTK